MLIQLAFAVSLMTCGTVLRAGCNGKFIIFRVRVLP
ncbi:hypothetical protein J2T15_003253 [Paenibacillus harenae]|uniref:Uncharacterized protein n=1 Tax=Paenibacillus harenae TaxID=306543 RepID=A0ABT9U2F8_PAEHA|nr:hypothetical protein [Paenibacillus harenae]